MALYKCVYYYYYYYPPRPVQSRNRRQGDKFDRFDRRVVYTVGLLVRGGFRLKRC